MLSIIYTAVVLTLIYIGVVLTINYIGVVLTIIYIGIVQVRWQNKLKSNFSEQITNHH